MPKTVAPEVEAPEIELHYVLLKELAHTFLQGNAKKHDIDKISESIRRYGFRDPLAIDTALNDGQGGISEGNGRLEGLLGMEEAGEPPPRFIKVDEAGNWAVPVLIGGNSRSEAEGKAYSLDHNNIGVLGGEFTPLEISKLYDPDAYLSMLGELAQSDDLPLSVDEDDLDVLLAQLNDTNETDQEKAEKDKQRTSELINRANRGEIQPRFKEGDIIALGRHRIACGDSTHDANIRALLGDRFMDVKMVWADPPYGIKIQDKEGRVGGGSKIGLGGKKREAKAYPLIAGDDSTDVARQSFEVCKTFAKACQIWWGANNYDFLPGSTCWIVWDKKTEKGDFDGITFADAELAYCSAKTAVRVFRHLWLGMWKQSEVSDARVHPTQKPIALCEWAFDKYGKAEDLIFDPFLGSAPSIIAAQKMTGDRTVYGFELSLDYIEVICQRFEKFTGQTVELIGQLPGYGNPPHPASSD